MLYHELFIKSCVGLYVEKYTEKYDKIYVKKYCKINVKKYAKKYMKKYTKIYTKTAANVGVYARRCQLEFFMRSGEILKSLTQNGHDVEVLNKLSWENASHF